MPIKIRGALRSVTVWVNGMLLAAWPFADQIIQGVRDNLPALQPYLPEDVFRNVGLAVVIFNIYQRARTSKSLAEKGSQ